MNIFNFCSDSFASVAAVSLVPIMENNKAFDRIEIYTVDDGISDQNKSELEKLVRTYNRVIHFIKAPDPSIIFEYSFKTRYQMGHSYSRMCIGTILPDHVEKVLCLDSDTLILDSLSELWNIDMGQHIMAGVSECINLKSYGRRFQLDIDNIYCNAGILLVDLKKMARRKY